MHLSACAAFAAFAALSQTPAPTNLYLLPNSSAVTPLTTSFRTDPFSVFSSFPVQPGASFLVMHSNGQKIYSIARSGADTMLVLDANNPSTVIKRLSLGQAEAAILSPDGKKLLIAAGSLHIIDTTNDTAVATLSDVGNTPTDVAVALDGSRAFDHSHIRHVEPELVEDGLHLGLGSVVVAANEHRRLDPVEVGVDHERVANATECLHEVRLRSQRLQPFHE